MDNRDINQPELQKINNLFSKITNNIKKCEPINRSQSQEYIKEYEKLIKRYNNKLESFEDVNTYHLAVKQLNDDKTFVPFI